MAARRLTKTGKILLWTVGVLAVLTVAFLIALDPIARHFTRKTFDGVDTLKIDFDDVHVGLFPVRYEITRLKVHERPVKKDDPPLFYAERIRTELRFLPVLAGNFIGRTRIEDAKIHYILKKPVQQEVKETAEKLRPPAERLQAMLEKSPPGRLDRAEIVNGEMVLEDRTLEGNPKIWIHNVDMAVENFASNRDLSNGLATTFALSGTMQHSGEVSMFLSADPLALPPHFAGRMSVQNFQLADLHDLLVAKANLKIPEGEFEMFSTFISKNGALTGGIKPMLKNVNVESADNSIGGKIKEALADVGFALLGSKDKADDRVATTIPIKGSLEAPEIQFWPAVLGVVRNAFVVGLAGGFSNTPPPEAKEKQGPIKQAVKALEKDEGPPKAQPQN